MKVVSISEEGDLVFNWDLLPEKVAKNTALRDKIYAKAQEEFKPGNLIFNSKLLFDINKFILDEIKKNIGGF